MANDVLNYVNEIQAIGAVPKILETVATMTGLRFVCIAHVTDSSWTTCAVLDKLDFGLQPGDGLDVKTTLCEEVRGTGQPVIIDSVRDSEQYREHHTPKMYGFQSYFSIPIFRPEGEYFGTLCGLDPEPAALSGSVTVSTMTLFAELISKQLETESALAEARSALLTERETSELREQFIAVLGHDLRTPLGTILAGVEVLKLKHPDPTTTPVLQRIGRSAARISTLVDDVVDFTRGRMGGGMGLNLRQENALHLTFEQVIDELRTVHPDRRIVSAIQPDLRLRCDAGRLAQLLSNLLKNALVHGSAEAPIQVSIEATGGQFVLAVTNHGPELSSAVIGQLFKPYWRPASRLGSEGLGLGLYIVSEIARAHGGEIDVVSADSRTSFTFTMPESAAAER